MTDDRAAFIGAGWVGSEPTWLSVSDFAIDGNRIALPVGVTDTSLPAGTYRATLRIGIADADENILGYRDAAITYVVEEALTASPTAVSFSQVVGGPAPAAQNVAVDGAGLAWTSSADQPWITLGGAAGTAPSTLAIGVDTTALAPGSFSGTVTIAGAAGDSVTVAVHLTVVAPAIQVSHDALAFSAVNGTEVATQTTSISMNNALALVWTAAPGADWIVLDELSGTTPGTLVVGVDPSRGPLASGSYSSTVTLTATCAGDTLTKVIPVDLTLTRPTLTVTPASLTVGGAMGRLVTPAPSPLSIGIGTGARVHPWTATEDHPWIGLDALSGTAGATPSVVHAVWDRTGLTGGTYTSAIDVTAVVNGDTLTAHVPVTLHLDRHLVLADDDGVAFASMPGLSTLTRTLHLRDNFGLSTAWTATADQPWVSVTPGGTTPHDLVITADPTGLSADTVHYATVTIASTEPTVERTEVIRVGLWVGSAAPQARASVATAFTNVVLDPIRPYAYVHAGGSALTVYNVYTGGVVTTLFAGQAALGRMAVASDGSRLFVADAPHRSIVVVNLANLSLGTSLSLGSTTPVHLASSRINGKRLLLAGDGSVFDATSGAALGTYFSGGYYGNEVLCTSQDGSRLAAQDSGLSPSSFEVYATDYTAVGGGQLFVDQVSWGSGGSNGRDIALDASGSRLYTANGAPYQFGVFDVSQAGVAATALTPLPGDPYPNNIEVAPDGRIFAGASVWYEASDVWIYAPAGTALGSMKLSGYAREILPGQLDVSGDGLRLVALTDDPSLQFVTVAP